MQAAERACLSSRSTQESRNLVVSWSAIRSRISSAISLQSKTDEIRGAVRTLPAQVQLIEDDKIRNCINAKITDIFALAVDVFQPASGNTSWPDPIDFRFDFVRGPSRNVKAYTQFLRADLQTAAGPISDRLVIQDPQGAPYFDLRLGYPKPNQPISGTIVAERVPTATLTSIPPAITRVCFQRPSSLPTHQSAKFEFFQCTEGKTCEVSDRATGWLAACGAAPPLSHSFLRPRFLTPVHAAEEGDPHSTAPYWNVPSVRALAEGNPEGVGYTIFELETDLFRRTESTGVEVGILVNGVSVREDGLPPDLRPAANRANSPFVYRFALQTLNFEGASGGCDDVQVTFRPITSDGRKGTPKSVRLSYVALRDVAPRVEKLGIGELKWSAAYITPMREWRNVPELKSYTYSVHDPAKQRVAVEQAESDKQWLDSQRIFYNGQQVVGVLRPPRTVGRDGTAAYGLAAGLLQENGQIRFTFSDRDARNLSAFMIAKRGKLPRASQVVNSKSYIFQAIGGSHTAPGACLN